MGDALAALVTGLWQVLAWPAFGFLMTGVAIGYVVGLLPGIGGPAALSLTLPLVLPLGPTEAFAVLIGLTAVTVTAGDMTSILLGVPGEATSTAIIADGHAMARRGEGGRAAGAAVLAALLGSVMGAAVLVLCVPVARLLLVHIGSPELMMLALLGICLVVPLSTRAPLKGLVAGGLGLMLATVGLDPAEGTPRFTFGQLFLWDGVGLLPVALGLFAVPEALSLATTARPRVPQVYSRADGARRGMRDALRHWPLAIRCGALGTGIGILPGVGASVSQWLAYAHASQTTRDPSRLGQGAIEGVIAPASASSATLGGALLPTLALGIPGSVSTAFLMGGLVLKGLTPGAALLAPERDGGHLSLVFAFAWMIVIANLVAAALGLVFLDAFAGLARVRPTRLFPAILTFIFVGAFAERSAAGDIGVAVVMGALGWAMARHDWPRAPLLLGLVLGPMVERRLLLATSAYGPHWVTRPGVIGIAVLAAIVLVRAMRGSLRGLLRTAPVPSGPSRGDLVLAGLIVLALVVGLWATRGIPGRAVITPRLVLTVTGVLASIQFGALLRSRRRRRGRSLAAQVEDARRQAPVMRNHTVLAWTAGFALAMWLLGFAPGACVMCAAYLRLVPREPWRVIAPLAAGLGLFVHLLVHYGMHAASPAWLLTLA